MGKESDILLDGGNNGAEVSVASALSSDIKLLFIYFSMHNCPPCREFTPLLAELYRETNENGKKMEVVFFSGDQTKEQFDVYFAEMPWLSLPH